MVPALQVDPDAACAPHPHSRLLAPAAQPAARIKLLSMCGVQGLWSLYCGTFGGRKKECTSVSEVCFAWLQECLPCVLAPCRIRHQPVSLYRCQDKLSKAVEGAIPPGFNADVQVDTIDFFHGWLKIRVPLQRQQTVQDRQCVKQDLIVRMYEHWISCREDARAQNCRIPCA